MAAEAWLDLLLSNLVSPRAEGPAVVLHSAQRWWPALEQRVATVWVHPEACAQSDFLHRPHQAPRARERLGLDHPAQTAAAAELLQRASLRVLVLPATPQRAAPLLQLASLALACTEAADLSEADWLVCAEAGAAPGRLDAPDLAELRQAAGWLPVYGPGLVLLASPALARRLAAWGLAGNAWPSGPESARRAGVLASRLAVATRTTLLRDTASGRPCLIWPCHPVAAWAGSSEAMIHQVQTQGRALFNARGGISLLLPWSRCRRVQLQVRNIVDRLDEARYCLGADTLTPAAVRHIDQGALLDLRLPALAAGANALLHISLPATALPAQGFASVGALEFSAELA